MLTLKPSSPAGPIGPIGPTGPFKIKSNNIDDDKDMLNIEIKCFIDL